MSIDTGTIINFFDRLILPILIVAGAIPDLIFAYVLTIYVLESII
jgi:hypothetical protein